MPGRPGPVRLKIELGVVAHAAAVTLAAQTTTVTTTIAVRPFVGFVTH